MWKSVIELALAAYDKQKAAGGRPTYWQCVCDLLRDVKEVKENTEMMRLVEGAGKNAQTKDALFQACDHTRKKRKTAAASSEQQQSEAVGGGGGKKQRRAQ